MAGPNYVNQILAKVYDALNAALRVSVIGATTGTFTVQGLGHALLDEITLDSVTWVEATLSLASRTALNVQNISGNGNQILWNYTGSGSKGWRIEDGGFRSIIITNSPTSKVYLKMAVGTGKFVIEELAP